MDLRVSEKLYERLWRASENYELSISDIARRAIRKWRRVSGGSVECLKREKGSTYQGKALKLLIPDALSDGLSGGDIRGILDWYLRIHESAPAPLRRPLELEPGREGVDYKIKEAV